MHVDHNMHVIGCNMHVTCTLFRIGSSKCVLEHDEINVHVVAVQSQVIANIKINFIHVCYWLIIDKAPNTGREYKIRDF